MANYQRKKQQFTEFLFGSIGTWNWLDKTVMDYANWAPDEPDSDYGEIGTSDGLWRSGRRWHDRAYICETPKGKIMHKMLILKHYMSI